jgi:hypothetical protein
MAENVSNRGCFQSGWCLPRCDELKANRRRKGRSSGCTLTAPDIAIAQNRDAAHTAAGRVLHYGRNAFVRRYPDKPDAGIEQGRIIAQTEYGKTALGRLPYGKSLPAQDRADHRITANGGRAQCRL